MKSHLPQGRVLTPSPPRPTWIHHCTEYLREGQTVRTKDNKNGKKPLKLATVNKDTVEFG